MSSSEDESRGRSTSPKKGMTSAVKSAKSSVAKKSKSKDKKAAGKKGKAVKSKSKTPAKKGSKSKSAPKTKKPAAKKATKSAPKSKSKSVAKSKSAAKKGKAKGSKSKEPKKEEKKGEKKEKDHNAPKIARSGYIYYTTERIPQLKKECDEEYGVGLAKDIPGKPAHTEHMKTAGKEWKEMTSKEKEPYMDKAVTDKERHTRQVKEYKDKGHFYDEDGNKVPPVKPN